MLYLIQLFKIIYMLAFNYFEDTYKPKSQNSRDLIETGQGLPDKKLCVSVLDKQERPRKPNF